MTERGRDVVEAVRHLVDALGNLRAAYALARRSNFPELADMVSSVGTALRAGLDALAAGVSTARDRSPRSPSDGAPAA